MLNFKNSLLFLSLLFPSFCLAQNLICQGPYRGKHLSYNRLQTIINTYQALPIKTNSYHQNRLNLCGVQLNGMSLNDVVLHDVSLFNADFSESDLQQANLANSDLTYSNLTNANLTNSNLSQANLTQANLTNAKLVNANLANANLIGANLTDANLTRANLQYANLTNANFTGANLQGADLNWASLAKATIKQANLENANFEDSNLNQANLNQSNLTNTNLNNSNLSHSSLVNTNMTDTHLANANLYHAIFQPLPNTIPNLMDFLSIRRFDSIRMQDSYASIQALISLRNAYQKMDIQSVARNLTAIIKYQQMRNNWDYGKVSGHFKAAFSYLLFYLTANFGAAPNRPLKILLLLIIIFSIPYYLSQRYLNWKIGVFQALYLSILNTLRIGWPKHTISDWLKKWHQPFYQISEKNWIKSLTISQVLLSAYLLILWLLLYFSHPFEWQ